MITRNAVLDALSGARDPELDEPITDLDFVSGLEIENASVFVRLRLPTYFCAPNFSYLMVADAKEAVLSVPGVERARVVLEDHYASEEINAGVNDERGFDRAFKGETEGPDLEGLRNTFQRKAFVSRQEQLCRALLANGNTPAELAELALDDVPPSADFETYLQRRAELGLDVSAEAPLVVDPDGNRVPKDAVVAHLRFARLTRVSIEGNAGLCRGLLATRYGNSSGIAR
ncbi:MAG: iron-sulfur cluster assembly protein [Actinomycetota bacterium]|nr:iron-sulfur cluster assembly protein [Actinomycetota bacterium]